MAKLISDLEIVGRWGPLTCYLAYGENLVKTSRQPDKPVVNKCSSDDSSRCLMEVQCIAEQWMRALRVLTHTSWPKGLTSRVAGLLLNWCWIETSFQQVHLRMIQGMRLPHGKAALEKFCWSAYPAVDRVFRMAAYLNPQTWDTWLDHQVLENSLTTAGLPRPIQLRIIYAETNPEDGRVLLYGFPRQDLPSRPTEEPIHLTPLPYSPTGPYVIAFLEYTFEKPEPDKPWQDETRYPGGIVMIGYLLP